VLIEKHTRVNRANRVKLKKKKNRYATRVKSVSMDGPNTVSVMFDTAAYYCDEFQIDQFIKCMGDWEAVKDQG